MEQHQKYRENKQTKISDADVNKNAGFKEKLDIYETTLTEETTCGFWIFQGKFLQRFANKKAYVILYGLLGCLFSATYAYFNGTITTLEKRFKIPSRTTGKFYISF